MTDAAIGYGSKYEIHDDLSPGAFVEVAEVFNLTPPSFTSDRIDATHMQSPNRTREFIAGLIDPGEAEFEMNFVPGSAADARIQALQLAGTVLQHRITFPNGVTWTYLASVIGYVPAAPTDDRMTATVTVAVSGTVAVA